MFSCQLVSVSVTRLRGRYKALGVRESIVGIVIVVVPVSHSVSHIVTLLLVLSVIKGDLFLARLPHLCYSVFSICITDV